MVIFPGCSCCEGGKYNLCGSTCGYRIVIGDPGDGGIGIDSNDYRYQNLPPELSGQISNFYPYPIRQGCDSCHEPLLLDTGRILIDGNDDSPDGRVSSYRRYAINYLEYFFPPFWNLQPSAGYFYTDALGSKEFVVGLACYETPVNPFTNPYCSHCNNSTNPVTAGFAWKISAYQSFYYTSGGENRIIHRYIGYPPVSIAEQTCESFVSFILRPLMRLYQWLLRPAYPSVACQAYPDFHFLQDGETMVVRGTSAGLVLTIGSTETTIPWQDSTDTGSISIPEYLSTTPDISFTAAECCNPNDPEWDEDCTPSVSCNCTATIEFVDENQCEDDAFDLYVINPDTGAERLVSDIDLIADPPGSCDNAEASYANISIPLDLTDNDWSADCRVTIEVRFKSANCCNTWTRWRIKRYDNSYIDGPFFNSSGVSIIYTKDELCGSEPPPPPPRPCCSTIAFCDNFPIRACQGTEQRCCFDLDPTADCTTVGEMPLITCGEGSQSVAQATAPNQAPFDCLGETHLNYLNGAFVSIDGWSFYDAAGTKPGDYDAWYIPLINKLNELMNDSYFAEWEGCFANADTTYTFAGPTVTIPGDDTYATSFEVGVILDMCQRSVTVVVTEVNHGFISAAAGAYPGARETITPPCNIYTGCYCSAYTEDIESIYTGTNGSIVVGL